MREQSIGGEDEGEEGVAAKGIISGRATKTALI
jgi:hypothetical protein